MPLIIAPPTGAAGAGYRRNATVGASEAFVSHTDIFPTLLEVLGVQGAAVLPPTQLAGNSLAPLLRGASTAAAQGGRRGGEGAAPAAAGGNFSCALTQIIRENIPQGCTTPRRLSGPQSPTASAAASTGKPEVLCPMGCSLRVLNWRYTAWVGFQYGNASTLTQGMPVWHDLRGEELYNHTIDDAGGGGGPSGDADNDFDASELVNLARDPSVQGIKGVLFQRLQEEWAK